MVDPVRVGVIGPSWWVNFWHLPAIKSHPKARLTAVCGATSRVEAQVAERYGPQVRAYTDWDTMLSAEALDGVIVCTPNDLHFPASMAALRRGLSVLCEKPVAMNAIQAREMADMARAKALVGMCNFPYRDNPAVQTFRRLTAQGYLGRLIHLRGDYYGGFGLNGPPGWRGYRERSGGGILADLGSHLIDLVRFVTQKEFGSVCAHTLTLLREPQSGETTGLARSEDPRVGPRNDDSCAFLAEMEDGVQAVLHTSWTAYQGAEGQHQEIEAFGTQGRLHFIANHAGILLRGKRTGESHWERIPLQNVIAHGTAPTEDEDYFRPGRLGPINTTYRWIEAIHRGEITVSPSLDDGWRSQQVIDAVILASAERRWVSIESVD